MVDGNFYENSSCNFKSDDMIKRRQKNKILWHREISITRLIGCFKYPARPLRPDKSSQRLAIYYVSL